MEVREGRWHWLQTSGGDHGNPQTLTLQCMLQILSWENYWALSLPTLCSERQQRTPCTQILLKDLDLARSPRQAYSGLPCIPTLGKHCHELTLTSHTASDIPECHPIFLAILLGFGDVACIQKMPPNTARTSTPLPERDYSTVSQTMQEKLKLNYWGHLSKTHISLHSNGGIHTEISPPNTNPSSLLLGKGINKEEEEEQKNSNGLLTSTLSLPQLAIA